MEVDIGRSGRLAFLTHPTGGYPLNHLQVRSIFLFLPGRFFLAPGGVTSFSSPPAHWNGISKHCLGMAIPSCS